MEYEVKLARAIECPTAAVAARTTWDEFPMLWKTLLDDVWAFLRDSGLRAGGHNVMLYKDDVPNVEVGVGRRSDRGDPGRSIALVVPQHGLLRRRRADLRRGR